MTLHLIQLRPDMPRLIRWAAHHAVLPRDDDDLGYAMHAALNACFADLSPAPFAFLRDGGAAAPMATCARDTEDWRTQGMLLAYSAHAAAALQEQAAAFALPDAIAALGLGQLAAKAMPGLFAAGRRLGFRVRVRPMVRTDRDGDRKRTREVDAFLAAVAGTAPGEGPPRADIYRDWLVRHLAEGGAGVETLTLQAFRLSQVHRRTQPDAGHARHLRRQEGPDAIFAGTLTVRDPERFSALLARGVGRHRAFGFGMLLLRPA